MNNKRARIVMLCAALIFLSASFMWAGIPTARAQETGSNWQGFYWDNISFTGTPKVTRTDPVINFNWKDGSPDPSIPVDNFSVRWYNTITFGGGVYRFRAGADDGIRVAIDGTKVFDHWFDPPGGFALNTFDVTLPAGNHQIIVDYYEHIGQAGVLFDWTTISGSPSTGSLGGNPSANTGTTVAGATFTPAPTPLPPAPPVRAVIIADIANIRSAPSTNSDLVMVAYKNQDFKVIGQNGANTWFLLKLPDGRTGWVWRWGLIYLYNGDWTKLPKITVAVTPAPVPQDVQGVAKVSAMVRSLPSAKISEKIGVIPEGQYFKILKRYARNRAWVWVDYNGLQGWVYVVNIKVVQGYIGLLPIGY